ncbi:hypothetical protein PCANB_002851 [Pneumocystis canis]|nr:hypothetical protein PCK1_002854 [Pneumocystis canis]KAG5438363.1 hypothetical protein PCANB_002851 [Pneumocystis canis]
MVNSDIETEKNIQNIDTQSIAHDEVMREPSSSFLSESHTVHNQFTNQQSKSLQSPLKIPALLSNINENIHQKTGENGTTVSEQDQLSIISSQSKYIHSTLSQSKKSISSPISATSTNSLLTSNCVAIKEKPSIRIHVPLKGQVNVYVNFAREAEKQYGWAALHPLQAANLVKLGISKFDHEVDSDDGDESEYNMEDDGKPKLSTVQADNENPQLQETFVQKPKKRKRRIQEEEYDTLDPFIDDSELFLEKIAASKDGFFVFSGPLIPKGDKIKIEKTEESLKKGRGRGGKQNTARINKISKPKESKSPKENSGKKNTKTTQNVKQTHEQLEDKEHTHLQKVVEKKEKETKEPKEPKIKDFKIIEEQIGLKLHKNMKEAKNNKEITNTQKNKKNKKTEKVEKAEKTEKVEKAEKTEKIEKDEKVEKTVKTEKVEKTEKI